MPKSRCRGSSPGDRRADSIDDLDLLSVTVPMNLHVAAAIQAVSDDAWQPIRAAVVSTVILRRFRS